MRELWSKILRRERGAGLLDGGFDSLAGDYGAAAGARRTWHDCRRHHLDDPLYDVWVPQPSVMSPCITPPKNVVHPGSVRRSARYSLSPGVISIVGWSVAFLLFSLTHGEAFKGLSGSVLAVGFLSLPLLIWEQYGSNLLTARDRIGVYNRAQVLGRTGGFLLLLLLVVGFHAGIMGALFATVGSQALVALGGLRVLMREAKAESRVRPCRKTVRTLLTGGLKLHLNAIGAFLFLYTDVLIVNHYRGAAETGFYQLAVQLVTIMMVVPQSAMTILASRVAQSGPDEAWHTQRRIIGLMLVGVAGLGLIAAFLAPSCVALIGSGKFLPAVGVFRVMLLNLFGMTLATMMIPQWIGRGLFWQASAITLTVGVLNTVANLLLVPRYGMLGSAWATVGTYLLSASVNLAFVFWIERRVRSARFVTSSLLPSDSILTSDSAVR